MWNNRTSNPSGYILYKHIQQGDYAVLAPSSPTDYHYSKFKNPDILDIALVKLPQVTNNNNLSLDHNPIILEVHCYPSTSTPPEPNKRINWIKFTDTLNKKITDSNSKTTTTTDINIAINNLTSNIQSSESNAYKIANLKKTNSLPPQIIQEIRIKNRLRRDWQQNRDPVLKRKLNS